MIEYGELNFVEIIFKFFAAATAGFELYCAAKITIPKVVPDIQFNRPIDFGILPMRWKDRISISIRIIGAAFLAWHIAYPFMDIIPFEWGQRDEYDDWHPAREDGRKLIAALLWIGWLVAFDSVEKTRERLKYLENQRLISLRAERGQSDLYKGSGDAACD